MKKTKNPVDYETPRVRYCMSKEKEVVIITEKNTVYALKGQKNAMRKWLD
jgi:hypothetical protein